MSLEFTHEEAKPADKVVFEVVFSEKEGGGTVDVSDIVGDVPAGTAVGLADAEKGIYKPIKGIKLVKAVTASDATMEVEKGSGINANDIIAFGETSKKVTKVDTSNPDKDVLTVTWGAVLPVGAVGYQAGVVSTAENPAKPVYTPKYLIGNNIVGGTVNNFVRFVNGASVRKETTALSDEVLTSLKNIDVV